MRSLPAFLRPPPRAFTVPLVSTGAATLLALGGDRVPASVAALGYVLAVTVSAAREGLWGGLAASFLSFLGLNFFFTPPRFTFVVEKTEDLIALFVFLAVSGIVGTLLSGALTQRARAERREREARLLHLVASRLLSGEPVAAVLRRFAESVAELIDLARCEVSSELIPESVVIERGVGGGEPEIFSMEIADREVGRIIVRPASADLGEDEREVIRTFASQMALALERMRFATEARRAQVEAEESRLRAALFSSVTHDLRTPLASITASVTSLEDEGTSFSREDRRELLETIRQEAERLNRMVGNFLDLARMKAGVVAPSRAPAAIDELIEAVVARLHPVLASHEVRLKLRDDIPEILMDVLQVEQVLSNILENAVKFSPAGSEIAISAARWQADVEVRVADRGSGIASEDRERVFEPFARGNGDKGQGTGLGLSIAQAIIVAHGGRMWIEPTAAGGTTVAFTIPVGSQR